MLERERILRPETAHPVPKTTTADDVVRKSEDFVFLDKDRIYHHKQVRRKQLVSL